MISYSTDKDPDKDGVYTCTMENNEDKILKWNNNHWEELKTGALVTEKVIGWIGPLQREIPPPPVLGIGRINKKALLSQDFKYFRWPACKPPELEYSQREYKYEATDPDMLFLVEWNRSYWECRADGYGYLKHKGQSGDYGNGPIFISKYEGVTLLATIKNKGDISYSDLEGTLKRALLSPQ